MSENAARVTAWLQDDGDGSVAAEESGVAGSVYADLIRGGSSEYGEAFDEERYMIREEQPEMLQASEEDASVVEATLGELARAAQRKTVSVMHREYARGRMLDVPRYGTETQRFQKYFALQSFMQMSSLDETTLFDQLSAGVVRTRLGAHTGLGKTMKLPGKIAKQCGLRVCQLELDTYISKSALKYQKKQYGIPGGVTAWCRTKKAYLTVMTYQEFRGIILSGNRERLFADFDVFYMDEAHEPIAPVWVSMQYFAEFAQDHNSLIVASATASSNEDNNGPAVNVGRFKTVPEEKSLEDLMDSGVLMTTELRDRTLVLVACDEDVALVRAYYVENGVDVFVLDTASTEADVAMVISKLGTTTAVVPRILVATCDYGTSYNLPVTYVITSGTRRVYKMDATHALQEQRIPLMQKQLTQHKGRVNRGVTSGGGGLILSERVSPDRPLLESEALEAYLSLVAANIKPRPGLFDMVTKVLPKGINAGVARAILRVGLPPALTVRYLGSDGLFATAYAAGIKLFSQTGDMIARSRDQYPLGYDQWVDERVGGYYVGDESDAAVSLRVPFSSPMGLKAAMHTISAVSAGLLQVDYWNWYDEEEGSDDELTGVRTRVKRVARPRMPEAPAVVKPAATTTTETSYWAYDADPSQAAKRERRQAMSWDAYGDGKTALQSLLRAVESQTLGVSAAHPELDVPEYDGKVAYALPLEDTEQVPVSSPGGGRIMLVAKPVHDKFVSGQALDATEATMVLQHLMEIRAVQRFAKCTAFDNWSAAWLCWLDTFGRADVMRRWQEKGIHSTAVKLLSFLYDRFRAEVISVCVSSNLYKDKLSGFFRSKPSISKLVSAAAKGKLPIAQTDAFIARVIDIKTRYDDALLALEESGVFAPAQITAAQRRLPLRDRNRRLNVIDEDVVGGRKVTSDDGISRKWRS